MPSSTTPSPVQLKAGATPPRLAPEQALALLWQQAPDIAFVVLDVHGIITGWQGAAEVLFGYQEAEAIGCPIDILFVEEDRALGLPGLERDIAVAARRSEGDRWHLRKESMRLGHRQPDCLARGRHSRRVREGHGL